MSAWAIPPRLERGDRYVRRGRLRVGRGVPSQRPLFMLEEALRLAALPGEDQGRVYCFRSISFGRLPANADRAAWLNRVQLVLTQWAARASHGGEARSAGAAAVFFRSRQEALEILLLRLVRGEPVDGWYWPLVSCAGPAAGHDGGIAPLVESLRESAGGWVSAARSVFAVLADADPLRLLAALPPARLQTWLRELGPAEAARIGAVPPPVPSQCAAAVRRAAESFGADAPQTLWLASLAVLVAAPAALPSGTVTAQARRMLQGIVRPTPAAAPAPGQIAEEPIAQERPSAAPASQTLLDAPRAATHGPLPAEPLPAGEITAYAGFYFLLNVLDRLGIARAPALADPEFVPELMERLAVYAGAPGVAAWQEGTPHRRDGADGAPTSILSRECPRAIRVWLVGVRRWCWRAARLTLREVVTRPGAVSWTRTDLDVTMPLDCADIRIRRAGLDLDPGWLPWLGRVVRFHYKNDWKDGRP